MYVRVCVYLNYVFFVLMIRRPPRSTRTDPLCPYTTLFRSGRLQHAGGHVIRRDDVELARLGQRLRRDVAGMRAAAHHVGTRSEEHTSELQSLMRISYAVFFWK